MIDIPEPDWDALEAHHRESPAQAPAIAGEHWVRDGSKGES